MQSYDENDIQVLEGLEAVRKRPGMYIGSTNSKGLHHLVYEIVDNSIDEALGGYCSEIEVSLNSNGSVTVSDNGRGMPVGLHPKLKIPAERVIFTILHSGGKFDNKSYKVSGGLHGVGASVVNALSKWLEVEISRDGYKYQDRYEDGGHPVGVLKDGKLNPIEKSKETGTKVTFMPDDTIFETVEFKGDIVKRRLRELAFLNKGLKIVFKDERINETIIFYEKDGIAGLVKELNKTKQVLHDNIIYLNSKSGDIEVEIALQYTVGEYSETILSFCNNINTIEGGTHVSGFKTALTRVINQYARELGVIKEKDENFDGRDVRNGITAIVLIKHPNPQYEGQTKTKIGNTDAKGAVEEVTNLESQKFFDRNVDNLKIIIDNALKSWRLRKSEEKLRKNLLSGGSKFEGNGKLASCSSKKPEECEIYLVEGDSAGGSAKQGRNRKYQAILPLRGKVLNVEKQDVAKIIANTEIKSLISALECGFGEGYGNDFNLKKLRYAKIIILTDADVDGAHIRTLLLTFFYRYMPELLIEGKIYKGIPPLYKITKGKKIYYVYSDKELEKKLVEIGKLGVDIQRYKGLGEMNPEQLWQTTLNPETRTLGEITIEDAILADEITNILMGDKVPPRREFIFEEALNAEIDV